MDHCIVCRCALAPDTKPQHLWLASLGGRKTTRRVVCSTCNGALGSGPDKALPESVALIRNMMNFESGKGDPPPVLRGQKSGNDRMALK